MLCVLFVVSGCSPQRELSYEQPTVQTEAVPADDVRSPVVNPSPGNGQRMDSFGCNGTGRVTLTFAPMDVAAIEAIVPLGMIIPPGHITPIDHQYYYPKSWKPELRKEDLVDVFAPAAGVVTSIEVMSDFFSKGQDIGLGDYRFIIHHSCTLYSIYIHLHELSPKLQTMIKARMPVQVAAGEKLGTATSFDFSLHDEDVTLTGFVVPKHYASEPWKLHTVDPFDYFTPELKETLLKKTVRLAEPRGGKIDYDVDGKLIGNWFVENTNGYAGVKQPNYYESHLAFAPDAYDPSRYLVGLGKDSGLEGVFVVDGPDPADVGVSSGIVTYRLLPLSYVDKTGAQWDRVSFVNGVFLEMSNPSAGVVLVQLLDARRLKLEPFPDAVSASDFTDKAVIYER